MKFTRRRFPVPTKQDKFTHIIFPDMYNLSDASTDAKIKFRLFLQQRCARMRLSFANSNARGSRSRWSGLHNALRIMINGREFINQEQLMANTIGVG